MRWWVLLSAILVMLSAGCLVSCINNNADNAIGDNNHQSVAENEQESKQGLSEQASGGGNMSAKVLFIIAQSNFRDEELSKPKAILEKAGHECYVASIDTALARGMLGGVVKPDLAVGEAEAEDFDLFVVVGGSGAPPLASHREVIELLGAAVNSRKKIAAICLGPMVLAKAGVLNGFKATVFKTKESLAALTDGGAIYVEQSVVVDGELVTASGPEAAEEFGNALVKLLQG